MASGPQVEEKSSALSWVPLAPHTIPSAAAEVEDLVRRCREDPAFAKVCGTTFAAAIEDRLLEMEKFYVRLEVDDEDSANAINRIELKLRTLLASIISHDAEPPPPGAHVHPPSPDKAPEDGDDESAIDVSGAPANSPWIAKVEPDIQGRHEHFVHMQEHAHAARAGVAFGGGAKGLMWGMSPAEKRAFVMRGVEDRTGETPEQAEEAFRRGNERRREHAGGAHGMDARDRKHDETRRFVLPIYEWEHRGCPAKPFVPRYNRPRPVPTNSANWREWAGDDGDGPHHRVGSVDLAFGTHIAKPGTAGYGRDSWWKGAVHDGGDTYATHQGSTPWARHGRALFLFFIAAAAIAACDRSSCDRSLHQLLVGDR